MRETSFVAAAVVLVVVAVAVLAAGCVTATSGVRLISDGSVLGVGIDPRPGMWQRTKAAYKEAPWRSTFTAAAIAGAGYFAYEAWASEQSDSHHRSEQRRQQQNGVIVNVSDSDDIQVTVIVGDGNSGAGNERNQE